MAWFKRGLTIAALVAVLTTSHYAIKVPEKEEVPYENPDNVLLKYPITGSSADSNGLKQPANYNIDDILKNNIFAPREWTAKKSQQEEKTEASHLPPLRLIATVVGDEEGNAMEFAVIKNLETNVQELYKPGGLFHGAKLLNIYRNEITFSYKGEIKKLRLYLTPNPAPVEKGAEPSITQVHSIEGIVNITSDTTREVNRYFFEKAGGIAAMLKKVNIDSYVVNGKGKGLLITGLVEKSIFSYLGFKNGDIIQAIGGQDLTSKQKTWQVLKKALTQPLLYGKLLRDNQEKEFKIKIK